MAIKFERDSNGNIIAVDSVTGKKIGSVSTIGDGPKEDEKEDIKKKKQPKK